MRALLSDALPAPSRLRSGLILDLDNTLYDFDSYFAYCASRVISLLEEGFGIPRVVILGDLHRTFQSETTIDMSLRLKDLPRLAARVHRHPQREQLAKAIDQVVQSATAELVPYPSVKRTLEWARNQDLVIVGISDAPAIRLYERLGALDLAEYFDGLYCWAGAKRERPATLPIPVLHRFAADRRKPDPRILREIVSRFKLAREQTYLVGDSIPKDIYLAEIVGVRAIWARYGLDVDPSVHAVMEELAPWQSRRLPELDQSEEVQVLSRFDQLRGLIEGQLAQSA